MRVMSGPASKAAYQDLFDRSIDAILLVEIASGKIIQANDASEKVFRVSKAEVEGKSIFDYCEPSFLPEFQKIVRIAARRYHPKTIEINMIVGVDAPPASQRVLIVTDTAISPLKLTDGTEVLQFIVRDITVMKAYMRQIEAMATTDGMTGLTNFRQFSKLHEAEHARALRYRSQYSIIFCDVDHFKKYNDQNGHPAGDALLKTYAEILRKLVRNTDVAARYGGEEFVILLPETDIKGATILAERIRATIAAYPFAHREKQPMGFVSCSIGVSGFPQDGADPKSVLKAADDLLYHSKHGGRNRVTVSDGKPRPPVAHQG